MGKRRTAAPKPTLAEAGILRQIARTRLIKTRLPDRPEPLWQIDGGGEISPKCAQRLILNGWVVAQRDGLSMFEDSQSYRALVP